MSKVAVRLVVEEDGTEDRGGRAAKLPLAQTKATIHPIWWPPRATPKPPSRGASCEEREAFTRAMRRFALSITRSGGALTGGPVNEAWAEFFQDQAHNAGTRLPGALPLVRSEGFSANLLRYSNPYG